MKALVARDRAAGVSGLALAEMPYPHMAENDVIVAVRAASFTPDELDWPGTWTDRAGRERTPTIPGHEVAGVVVELGFGTTGLEVGQPVIGLTDWCRNGTLAEFVAVEARNLAPLSEGVDRAVAAALPMTGLTAWQGLFDHGQLSAGQSVVIHGAAGGVGSLAVQLALDAGARVIGSGRTSHKERVLGLGVDAFLDLQQDRLEDLGKVDVVFDVLGGEILDRSIDLVRPGGTLVSIAGVPTKQPDDARALFFIVEPDRRQLADLENRLRDGRLRPAIGATFSLVEAASAFDPAKRAPGKTIIQVAEG
jgi:NADPH:quinone reductase-like Zn-dependent oxidoreductase